MKRIQLYNFMRFYIYIFIYRTREKRALLSRVDVDGSRQAPPRRISGNVTPTEELRDEARLRAVLLGYGALVCEIIAFLSSEHVVPL